MSGRDPVEAVRKALEDSSIPTIGTTTRSIARGELPPVGGGAAAKRKGGSVLPVVTPSRQIPQADLLWQQLVGNGDVISPPYDPWVLTATVEESDILPALVDAMAVNVAHGVELVPTFATTDPETGLPAAAPADAEAQRAQLEAWVAGLNPDLGLTGVLDRAQRDLEKIGWATLEVLRDKSGEVAALEHLPAYTTRLGRGSAPILVDSPVVDPQTGGLARAPRYVRFRTIVQVVGGVATYFKAFGDPRFINHRTGQAALTSWGVDELGNALDATEVLYVDLYSGHSPYGVPRWVGASTHVRAGRSTGEVIAAYFDGAPIGAKLAMLVGGTFRQDSLRQALDKIDGMARGVENAFTLITIEANAGSGAARDPLDETRDAPARLTLEDLVWELPESWYLGPDSLLEGSSRRLRRTFRLPPIFTGDADDYSRASAETSNLVADQQVFQPARALWHRKLDRLVLELGITRWQLRLRGPKAASVDGGDLAPLVDGGGATPNQLRARSAEVLGQPFRPIPEAWGDRPIALVLELVKQGLDPNQPLSDLAAEVAKRQEAEAKQAAERLSQVAGQARAGASARSPAVKAAADLAAQAVADVVGLQELQARLVDLARAEE